MEGSVSEEPKSVQSGGAETIQGGSEHRVKCKSLKKKLASRVQRGTDASEGGSKGHQVKRKRVKELFSWFPRRTDASQGGSKRRQLKCKKVKECASRVQSGVDAMHGQIFVGSESHLVKCNGIKKKRVSRVQSRIHASGGQMVRRSRTTERLIRMIKSWELDVAKTALEFYQKSQDDEFEIVAVLHANCSLLTLPGSNSSEERCHVSFIAKPKNVNRSDVSPKFFFAELVEDDLSGEYNATYCSTFEPRYYTGSRHGCVFCSPGERFHPAEGYRVGCTPWQVAKVRYV